MIKQYAISINDIILRSLEDASPTIILTFLGYFYFGHSVTQLAKMLDERPRTIQTWLTRIQDDVHHELERAGGVAGEEGETIDVDSSRPREISEDIEYQWQDDYQDLDTFIEELFYK